MQSTLRTVLLIAALCTSSFSDANELLVGQVAPFGGNLAVAARDFNLGLLIAFDETNSAGGIAGQNLRLVSRDDGNRSDETVRLVDGLIKEERPVALIGLWGADSAQALLTNRALERSNLPVVGVRSGVVSLRKQRLMFYVRANFRDEVTRMVSQVSAMGVTRVAIVHEEEPFALDALAAAREGLLSRKIELVAVAAVPHDTLEVRAAVSEVVAAAPEAVFLFANTNMAAAFIKPFRKYDGRAFILATSSVEVENLVAQIGTNVARGVSVAQSVPNPYRATTSVAMAMRNRMKSLGIADERANFASLEGYITARIVIEALKRCGHDPKAVEVAKALETLHHFDVGGFFVDFSPNNHEGSHFVDLSVIAEDGKVRQ